MVSLTSLNLSRSMSTTENGRPERDARFHSADKASQKKRRVLMPVRPSVIDCCCSFWKTKALCSAVANKSASVLRIRHVLRRECIFVVALNVEHAEQRFTVGDGNAQHCARIGQDPGQIAGQSVLHQGAFSGARDAAEDAGSQEECACPWRAP